MDPVRAELYELASTVDDELCVYDSRTQYLHDVLQSLTDDDDCRRTPLATLARQVAATVGVVAELQLLPARLMESARTLCRQAAGISDQEIDDDILFEHERMERTLGESTPDEPEEEEDILPRINEVARDVVRLWRASPWRASPRLATARANLDALAEEDVEDVSGQAYARDVALMTMLAAHDNPALRMYSDRADDMYRAVLRLRGVPDARIEDMVTTEMNETYNEYIEAMEEDEEDEEEEWEQPEPVDEQGNDWYLQHREMYLNRSIARTDVPTLRATQPVAMRAVPDRTLDSMAPLLGDRPHGISAGQTYFMCTNPVPHYYDAQKYDEYCQGTVTTEVTPAVLGKGCLRCPYCRTLMDTQLYQVPVRRSERLRR